MAPPKFSPLVSMHSALLTLQIVALAALSAMLLRRSFPARNRSRARATIAEAISTISMGILFPLSFVEAMSRHPESLSVNFGLLMIGFLIPALFFVCANFAVTNLGRGERSVFDVTFSTMGGGNRGVSLISLLVAAGFFGAGKARDQVTASFFALDLGNFIFFYTTFTFLLQLKIRQISDTAIDTDSAVQQNGVLSNWFKISARVWPIFAVIPFVVWQPMLGGWLADQLSPSYEERKALLLFLSTTYVFFIAEFRSMRIRDEPAVAGSVLLLRFLLLATLLLAVGAMTGQPATFGALLDTAHVPAIGATVVLLMCPPSSVLPLKLATMGFPTELIRRASGVVGLSGAVFAFILVLVSVFNLNS